MVPLLMCVVALVLGHAESNPEDALSKAYPVYSHANIISSGSGSYQQSQSQSQSPSQSNPGFNVKDIEHKPIFVLTTADSISYDIVYAGAGIGGLNADPVTKYIADFLASTDSEKMVIVFNYNNFPFNRMPDLPISKLILPNGLHLAFFATIMDIPIVVIVNKDQIAALDNYIHTNQVNMVGQIKIPPRQ